MKNKLTLYFFYREKMFTRFQDIKSPFDKGQKSTKKYSQRPEHVGFGAKKTKHVDVTYFVYLQLKLTLRPLLFR